MRTIRNMREKVREAKRKNMVVAGVIAEIYKKIGFERTPDLNNSQNIEILRDLNMLIKQIKKIQ